MNGGNLIHPTSTRCVALGAGGGCKGEIADRVGRRVESAGVQLGARAIALAILLNKSLGLPYGKTAVMLRRRSLPGHRRGRAKAEIRSPPAASRINPSCLSSSNCCVPRKGTPSTKYIGTR